jgi:hypothetical protein
MVNSAGYHEDKAAEVKKGTLREHEASAAEAATQVLPDAKAPNAVHAQDRTEKHGTISTYSSECRQRRQQQILHVITTVGDMGSLDYWLPEARLHDAVFGTGVFGLSFRPPALTPYNGLWKNGDQIVTVDGKSALTNTPDGAAELRDAMFARGATARVEVKFYRPRAVEDKSQHAFIDALSANQGLCLVFFFHLF